MIFIALVHLSRIGEPSQDQSGSASFQKAIQSLLENIRRLASQQANTVIDDWLNITRFDEQYNVSHHYEKQVLSRLEGTCKWIFSKSAYCTWVSEDFFDEKAKFLWICGPPGYGKTMLCATLVEHFKDNLAFPIAYFFASAHAQSGGRPIDIVRSWIGQIARADYEALDLVRGYCERSEAGRVASETEIWSMFESIISQKPNYTFSIDGFDEYARLDESRAHFLRRLKKTTEGTSTRILVSSRDEVDIRSELLSECSQTTGLVILECKISKGDVRDDITFYSRNIVNEKLPQKNEALRQDLASQLAERCEGMFLWIKLQQDQLRGGKNGKQLQNIVKNMPTGLNQTYERNWKTIQSRPVDEQRRALAILRWTTFALRPLTVSEMTEALIVETEDESAGLQWDELPDTIDYEYINGEIIDICGCLLETREEDAEDSPGSRTIHLIHPSVRDFLLSALSPNPELILHHSLLSDQASDRSGHHNYLAKVCLTYLNRGDLWERSNVDQVLKVEYAFLEYAANYWYSHIDAAGQDDNQVIHLVNEFLRPDNVNFELWRDDYESLWDVTDERYIKAKAVATPLHYAALFNLIPSMEFMLKKGTAQLNAQGGQYGTPLQAACLKGHQLAVDTLIQWGADPNVQGGQSGVPLNAAIARGYADIVKSLIKVGADLELRDSRGRTPLYIAAVNGYPAIADFLLEAGAKLKTEYEDEWAPLIAAANNCHIEVVKLLLDRGADPMESNIHGWTPMHAAAANGHLEVVELLLDRGADIMKSFKGCTPIHLAAENGHLEVVEVLLNRGSSIPRSCQPGERFFGHHFGGPYGSILNTAAYKGYLKMLQMLVEKFEANITATDGMGRNPLHLAVRGGNIDCVNYLLDGGLRCSDTDNIGNNVFYYACSSGSTEVVQRLLEFEPLTLAGSTSWTPLHWACRIGGYDLMHLLLSHGIRESVVHTTYPSARWTPASIGIFHRNPFFEIDAQLSWIVPGSPCTELFPSTETPPNLQGIRHESYYCDGCFHVSSIRTYCDHPN